MVPLVVGLPFAHVGEQIHAGKSYRAYFTADYVWRRAVVAEVAKGDVPPVNPFYRIRYDDGTHFDYGNDAQANREQIRSISPADLPGYERFVAEAEDGRTLCLQTYDSRLEIWDRVADRMLQPASVPNLSQVVAVPGGCVTLAQGEAMVRLGSGGVAKLAAGATAVPGTQVRSWWPLSVRSIQPGDPSRTGS